MKKNIWFLLLVLMSTNIFAGTAKNDKVKVRVGWQVPWAIQGQIVEILKNTAILSDLGIEAEFIGKTAGPELNELAMGDQVDLILTADQPGLVLFSKKQEWKAISRLMYNRTATYVPLKSDIKTLADLKNKKVGVPFGTAAQRIIVQATNENKVEGVQFLNFGIL